MATKWAHLPNATHIDWVINSVQTNPYAWGLVVRDAASNAARDAAWDAAGDAAGDAVMDAAWVAAWAPARDAVMDTVLALVAYDDCEKYLDMTPDALQVWAVLSNDPATILLLPRCKSVMGPIGR